MWRLPRQQCSRSRTNHPDGSAAGAAMNRCSRCRTYGAWRTAEGKTTREIVRCIERSVARAVYKALTGEQRDPWHPAHERGARGCTPAQAPTVASA